LQEIQPQYDLLAVYNNLTNKEKELCLNIIKCAATRVAATEAVTLSVNTYWWDDTPGDNGPRNAFQHAYWNALMVFCCGEVWAFDFANAHEDRPTNPALAKAMDLANNAAGRSVARYTSSKSAAAQELKARNREGSLRIFNKAGTSLVASNTYIDEWLEVP
ncbi:MAG: hypothetical protein N2Z75_05115, partial [Meiothermus sp.]|nr:hypothetical protein [Meiothermus sp.]